MVVGLLAAVLAALVAVVVAPAAPAAANCVGPEISVSPSTVAPGGLVTVKGQHFGTDCNDTGRPGPVLGDPQNGIQVSVRVGDAEKLVAVVEAASDYSFELEVSVPPSLGEGSGEVIVQQATETPTDNLSAPVEVTGSPVQADDAALIQVSGVPATDDDGPSWAVIGLAILLAVLGAVGLGFVIGRRRS